MDVRTRFLVQAFEHVGGRLVATRRDEVPNETHALRQAEALAARLSGAAALKRVETDRGAETIILGAFGDVPNDFSDGLAGG